METLFAPINAFIAMPWLAFLPALLFWLGFRKRRGRLLLAAAAVWTVYGIYEWAVYEWSKTVTAPIRVDLLVITPVLYAVTALGIYGLFKRRRGAAGAS